MLIHIRGALQEKALACAGIDSRYVGAGKGIFTELDTVLRFRLSSEQSGHNVEGTKLVLEQTGFSGLKLSIVSYIMAYGWRKILNNRLPGALEKMRMEEATANKPLSTES